LTTGTFETGSEPARDPEAEQRYREVVLVVRGGFPAQKLAATGVDQEPLTKRHEAAKPLPG
jgi:hypothetical protein